MIEYISEILTELITRGNSVPSKYHVSPPGFTALSTLRTFGADKEPPTRWPIPNLLFAPVAFDAAFGVVPLAIKVGGRNAEFAGLGGAVSVLGGALALVTVDGGLGWILGGLAGCGADSGALG